MAAAEQMGAEGEVQFLYDLFLSFHFVTASFVSLNIFLVMLIKKTCPFLSLVLLCSNYAFCYKINTKYAFFYSGNTHFAIFCIDMFLLLFAVVYSNNSLIVFPLIRVSISFRVIFCHTHKNDLYNFNN